MRSAAFAAELAAARSALVVGVTVAAPALRKLVAALEADELSPEQLVEFGELAGLCVKLLQAAGVTVAPPPKRRGRKRRLPANVVSFPEVARG